MTLARALPATSLTILSPSQASLRRLGRSICPVCWRRLGSPDDWCMKLRKKLIEVALPLEAINKAAAREKSIRHGHPSTLHLWWARRPLAAARAVIFAQMLDDPSSR